ncbi:MAG: hypothetical protein CMH31_02030 [Micavibrio sp.]|nr:hypothetical protein [Micavibrio sp.]
MTQNKSTKIIAIISLISIVTLTGCSRMPKLWENSNKSNAPAPKMKSVMANGSSHNSMQSARGLSTSNLFSEQIRSDSGRLDRLENSVQAIRNELDSVRPSIDRLVAIEGDVQTLIGQLETLAQGNHTTPAQPTTITPKMAIPTATKVKSAPPAPSSQNSSGTSVHNVRIGEHPGKTRIVLDLNSPATFKADLDNNENILNIEIANTDWTAAKQKSFRNSSFISSYSVKPLENNQGFLMIVELKKAARIAYKDSIKALSGNGRRIIIDLAN